ncbi:hypothetical protein GALL_461470 [mine drainage metagenome]|uniref:Uncharacterized protein n=1 Tax=mine drainage metagenome TaxID=410659 RepID=A0A1J5PL20_9ZZZZ
MPVELTVTAPVVSDSTLVVPFWVLQYGNSSDSALAAAMPMADSAAPVAIATRLFLNLRLFIKTSFQNGL